MASKRGLRFDLRFLRGRQDALAKEEKLRAARSE